MLANLDSFLSNQSSVNALLTSEMITGLFEFMQQSSDKSSKKKLITEILIKLNKIFLAARLKNPDNSPQETPYKRTDAVMNMIAAYQNLEHGRKFTSLMSRIKLLALLNGNHSALVSKYGQSYQTDRQMYNTSFKKTFICPSDMIISIEATTTKKAINIVKTADKSSIMIDVDGFKQGKNFSLRVNQGEEVVIEFPVGVNEVMMSGTMTIRNATEDSFNRKEYANIEGIESISA
jgi:hypothetical protein